MASRWQVIVTGSVDPPPTPSRATATGRHRISSTAINEWSDVLQGPNWEKGA